MVLMSFFILFFQFDTDEQWLEPAPVASGALGFGEKIILRLQALSLEKRRAAEKEGAGGAAPPRATRPEDEGPVADGTRGALADFGKAVQEKGLGRARFLPESSDADGRKPEVVVIDFPDDAFARGAFRLAAQTRLSTERFFDELARLDVAFEIDIVGHSDPMAIGTLDKRYVADNYALSALRASHVASVAFARGIPRERIRVSGEADVSRGTRSFSVRIRPQGSTP